MQYLIQPSNTPVTLTPKLMLDVGKTQRAVKSALTRAGIDWMGVVPHTRFCAWCQQPNAKVILKLILDGPKIHLENGGYAKELNCCFVVGCTHKALNPNSVEFVAKSRGITESEALEFLHTRNRSPFYRNNHKDDSEYQSYQGTRCFNNTVNRDDIISKQNFARSLDGYIARFGVVDGPLKWKTIQKQKGITLENLARRHGEGAVEKLQQWKNSVSCSLENFIRRHGEGNGKALFRQTVGTHGFYSPVTFTANGSALRSNLERTFFEILTTNGLTEGTDFSIDGQYPGVAQRYDFWFPKLNLFVEIAGSSTREYRDKMKQKRRDFGAMIVTPARLVKVANEIAQCLNQ